MRAKEQRFSVSTLFLHAEGEGSSKEGVPQVTKVGEGAVYPHWSLWQSPSCAGYGPWLRANRDLTEWTVFSSWISNCLHSNMGKGPQFKPLREGCLLLGFPDCLAVLKPQRWPRILGSHGWPWLMLEKATALYRARGAVEQEKSCRATLPMAEIQAGWWPGCLSCIRWGGCDCGGMGSRVSCSPFERWQREDPHPTSWSISLCYFCCFLHIYNLYNYRRADDFPSPSISSSLDKNAAGGSKSTPHWCHLVLKGGARRSAQGLCWGLRQASGVISQGNATESTRPNQRATVMPNYLTGTIYLHIGNF